MAGTLSLRQPRAIEANVTRSLSIKEDVFLIDVNARSKLRLPDSVANVPFLRVTVSQFELL